MRAEDYDAAKRLKDAVERLKQVCVCVCVCARARADPNVAVTGPWP